MTGNGVYSHVLVTGGSGFIGTNLVEHYVRLGSQVLNLDIAAPRNPEHMSFWEKVDLLDSEALTRVVAEFQPTCFLHMGARTDLDGTSLHDYAANTNGVRNVIDSIEKLGSLRKVIFASSRLVCRIGYQPTDDLDYCPTTPYGESKVLGEKIVHEEARRIHCPWVIVRPTSIWGPWFDVPYKTFFVTIAKGRYFHPGHVKILKSFGFVGNTVYELDRLLATAPESINGKTFYLADYPPIEVSEFGDVIQKMLGVKPIRGLPVSALRAIAAAGDVLRIIGWKHQPLTTFRLSNLLTPMVHDLEPLREVVGELPYSMEEGVRITADWLRSQGEAP